MRLLCIGGADGAVAVAPNLDVARRKLPHRSDDDDDDDDTASRPAAVKSCCLQSVAVITTTQTREWTALALATMFVLVEVI
jgi:hypothetical protein